MRIVIDLVGAQSESRTRGIGRYALSLSKAIAANPRGHEIVIALSDLFPGTIEPIRREFRGILPAESIRVWRAPGPVSVVSGASEWRRIVAETIREGFLASLQPDVVLLTSLFEGYVDDAVTSVGRIESPYETVVVAYDLIPLVYEAHYLSFDEVRTWYFNKLAHLRHADHVLAISESTRQDCINRLQIEATRVTNIGGAVESYFSPVEVSRDSEALLRRKLGIDRAFVTSASVIEYRRNVEGLIRSYARLDSSIRQEYQLVIVGSIQPAQKEELKAVVSREGLRKDEVIFTGRVSDDDLRNLYNLCSLFVFPSFYEGLGLPVLEAMACGAPAIAADRASLPEIIENPEALFDPESVEEMAAKIRKSLVDQEFRESLVEQASAQMQKFSWRKCAADALSGIERLSESPGLAWKKRIQSDNTAPLRLAYVSPIPPQRSGISDYSDELLPALAKHYDVEVVVPEDVLAKAELSDHFVLRSPEFLIGNRDRYDRVLYHFGNSPFHSHMFQLLRRVPGVVVLHDFFLSSLLWYLEEHDKRARWWTRELYRSHGYPPVAERSAAQDPWTVVMKYPCSLSVLEQSLGVISHSDYSRRLAKEWYGFGGARDWEVIPMLRRAPDSIGSKLTARQDLAISADDFLVCSFGAINEVKRTLELLEAWIETSFAQSSSAMLAFVGQEHGGEYGARLRNRIRRAGLDKHVQITGWVDQRVYRQYLRAADLAVQLRSNSRGETSAAVLDCLNYGVPTIANANGSLAELSESAVWMLPDDFSTDQLAAALESLRDDPEARRTMSEEARHLIHTKHTPDLVAKKYGEVIEQFYVGKSGVPLGLAQRIGEMSAVPHDERYLSNVARAIASSVALRSSVRRLFLDISATARKDRRTGIERVSRALSLEFLRNPPKGFRVEPVYLDEQDGNWFYRSASKVTLQLLGAESDLLAESPIEFHCGDVLLGLDLFPQVVEARDYLDRMHRAGVKIHFTVFDVLPIDYPHFFPPGATDAHRFWLEAVLRYDAAICISHATAERVAAFIEQNRVGMEDTVPCEPLWFHLGADLDGSGPSTGLPGDSDAVLEELRSRPTFLMVGTVEPRKGYLQVIEGFTRLWNQGHDVNLVIVGKEGWTELPDSMRRTIPQIIQRLRSHPELGKRLFWLSGISDEFLESVYGVSSCLLAASEGEGFGLPLIEGAQHGLPIIARDIPVFREVAGEYAHYFAGLEPDDLANAVREWLRLWSHGNAPRSEAMPWLTWRQSASAMIATVLETETSPAGSEAALPSETAYENAQR